MIRIRLPIGLVITRLRDEGVPHGSGCGVGFVPTFALQCAILASEVRLGSKSGVVWACGLDPHHPH